MQNPKQVRIFPRIDPLHAASDRTDVSEPDRPEAVPGTPEAAPHAPPPWTAWGASRATWP